MEKTISKNCVGENVDKLQYISTVCDAILLIIIAYLVGKENGKMLLVMNVFADNVKVYEVYESSIRCFNHVLCVTYLKYLKIDFNIEVNQHTHSILTTYAFSDYEMYTHQ